MSSTESNNDVIMRNSSTPFNLFFLLCTILTAPIWIIVFFLRFGFNIAAGLIKMVDSEVGKNE